MFFFCVLFFFFWCAYICQGENANSNPVGKKSGSNVHNNFVFLNLNLKGNALNIYKEGYIF